MSKEVEISEPSLKDRIVLQGKKIKDHVEENKWVYIGGVLVVLSRGYFKPRMAPTLNVADIMATVRPIGILSKQDVTTNFIRIFNNSQGRPGHLTYSPELNRGFPTQGLYAEAIGVPEWMVSKYFHGGISNVKGHYPIRIPNPV